MSFIQSSLGSPKVHQSQKPISARRWHYISAVVLVILYFHFFIARIERVMDDYLNEHTFRQELEAPAAPKKYILYDANIPGQGMGNLLNGLLSAHMLGDEFDRIVCVSEAWTQFHAAFRSKLHGWCSGLKQKSEDEDPFEVDSARIIDFDGPVNECELQRILGSDRKIVYIVGNTYPRWAGVTPGLWDQHYEPRKKLTDMLPYDQQPSTVVHLRCGDNVSDKRKGLRNATLVALKKNLPADTYLVTNKVGWYKYFSEWKNPGWHGVRHSALVVSWAKIVHRPPELVNLELFADWYTILKANRVYHTPSSFSQSAIHFNNIGSKMIVGLEEDGRVKYEDESFRRDPEAPRLVDRKGDQLKECNLYIVYKTDHSGTIMVNKVHRKTYTLKS